MTTIGKTRGLARLADDDGFFRMVALDQRPPLFDALAQAMKIPAAQVAFSDVVAAKRLLVKVLGRHCSSMLFDPNFAMPAAIDVLPPRCGLIVTLEEHRTEESAGGRKSRAIADWSVEKIRALGGDAVKVLAWYRPDAAPDVCAHQQAFVRAVGDACRRHDIPFVFELLVYPLLGAPGHTADYVEAPGKLPHLVIDSVREFAKPEYGVDLFKLESPISVKALPARDGGAASNEAQAWFDALGEACAGVPWVLLSGGASAEMFGRVLEYSYAAGASGFLAGRTIWLDAIRSHYPDKAMVERALAAEGVRILEALGELTKQKARAWRPAYPSFASIAAEGDFARAYQPASAAALRD